MSIVSESQITKILWQYNPWWRNPDVAGENTVGTRRFTCSEVVSLLQDDDNSQYILLCGPRRVGKTTILYHTISSLLESGVDPLHILYVSFDSLILRHMDVDTVLALYESIRTMHGPRYIFLDEVQYTSDWQRLLESLHTEQPDVKVVAACSALPMDGQGMENEPGALWHTIKVPTLSFYEYCVLSHADDDLNSDLPSLESLVDASQEELDALKERFAPLEGHFHRYLSAGGFPEVVLRHPSGYDMRRHLKDMEESVIKRDVMGLFQIQAPEIMEKLFIYLCIHSGQVFNAAKAAREIQGTTPATLVSYVHILEKAHLVDLVYPLSLAGYKNTETKPRIYICDATLRNSILMVDDVLENSRDLSAMVEACILRQIHAFCHASSIRPGYLKTGKLATDEISIVFHFKGQNVLTHVKYANNAFVSDTDLIARICSDASVPVSKAFVATRKLDDFHRVTRTTNVPIIKIPALILLYLLGRQEDLWRQGTLPGVQKHN